MGSFLGNVLGGAAQGFLVGGPQGAIAGGVLGGISGGGGGANAGGISLGAGNASLANAMSTSADAQVSNQIAQMQFDTKLQQRNLVFNQMLEQQSESMKEINQLRDVAMQQRKADDSITKEYISSIK